MTETHAAILTVLLTNHDLATRWGEKDQTVRLRRHRGDGPPFVRIGRRALYRLSDVIAFEESRKFSSTSDETARRTA